uniref:Lysophospholipid acyltransferase 1-like n=1 Tax=Tanacetum cinerariifolium TaxID=118510 RepID=A0A6L2NGT5_TANCI|nr:lysophospholipid acyltransferase 1-like [Tanacetum cinerariifolium]
MNMEEMALLIGVSPPICQFLICFVATIPLSFFHRYVPGGSMGKHIYAALTGAVLSYMSFGLMSNMHFLVLIIVSYASMVFCRKQCGLITFFLAMGYLIGCHVYYMSGDLWKEGGIDATGSMMVITLKVISCAINYSDGLLKEAHLRQSQKNNRLIKLPSFIEYVGYCLCCGSHFAGPVYEMKDYLDWTERKGIWMKSEKPSPSPYVPTVKALFQAECSMILSGLGFSGWTSSSPPIARWGRAKNVDILGVEFAKSAAEIPLTWNIHVSTWLRHYVYDRLVQKGKRPGFFQLLATQTVSAIWHGVYPGYIIFFVQSALMISGTKSERNNQRIQECILHWNRGSCGFYHSRCFENDENADGGKKEDDMGACIEKLDKVGWAAQDPMYDSALLLFGQSADYKKLWLHLKPESCGNWVKSVGRKFRLLDFIFRVIFSSCSCTRIFIVAEKEVSTIDLVTTGGEVVTTTGVEVITTAITSQISMDDITLAKALVDIKTSKPKAKGVVIQEPNYELASRLQEEVREELSIEEKSRLFVELIDKRKKHFARFRAKKIKSKPPTKAQKRNQMCTYLKNMENYKHKLVKGSEKVVEGSEKAEEGSSKRGDVSKHFIQCNLLDDAFHWLEGLNRELKHCKLNMEDHDHPIMTSLEIAHKLHRGRNFLESFDGPISGPILLLMELPHMSHLEGKFFESCGCLLLVCRDDIGSTDFTIYEIMKGSSMWSIRYLANIVQLLNRLPEGWSIQTCVWSICLGEDDAFVVINLSGKVVKYNLISNTNTKIFDIGSNQMDDDDDDAVLFIPPFEVDHNLYEFIPSLASV